MVSPALFTLPQVWEVLPEGKRKPPPDRMLTFDPGETTGSALFAGFTLVDFWQLPTGLMPEAATIIERHIKISLPLNVVVCEDYRVYAHRSRQHIHNALHTPRLIGAIELICQQLDIRLVKQSAAIGKAFVTDDRLQSFGMYRRGQRHARDAIRHGCQYILWPTNPPLVASARDRNKSMYKGR